MKLFKDVELILRSEYVALLLSVWISYSGEPSKSSLGSYIVIL